MSEPLLRSSMYFLYNRDSRPEITSRSTFEAARIGERTATTRFPDWPQYDLWCAVRMGDRFRVYQDRECIGASIDCIATSDAQIFGQDPSDKALEEWSRLEGWTPEFGRRLFSRHGPGVQIRFRIALPDDRFVGGLF